MAVLCLTESPCSLTPCLQQRQCKMLFLMSVLKMRSDANESLLTLLAMVTSCKAGNLQPRSTFCLNVTVRYFKL